MTTPGSSSIVIPSSPSRERRGSRRVSVAYLHDLEEPRPPGGWNTLERFASSYQRSQTFFRLDATSPGSSLGLYSREQRPGIPSFEDEDSAVVDDDEETGLLSARGSRRGTGARRSQTNLRSGHDEGGDVEDHFAEFRGTSGPKSGDEVYGTIRRGSRRSSLIEHGGPELLIKEVEDEAGNIIEVVVGQVWQTGSMGTDCTEYGTSNDLQFHQYTRRNWVVITAVGIQVQWMGVGRNYHDSVWSCYAIYSSNPRSVYGSRSQFDHVCRYWMVTVTMYFLRCRLAFGNKHRIVVSLLFSLELTATWYRNSTLYLISVSHWSSCSLILSMLYFQTSQQRLGSSSHSSYSSRCRLFPSTFSHTPLFSVS